MMMMMKKKMMMMMMSSMHPRSRDQVLVRQQSVVELGLQMTRARSSFQKMTFRC